MIFGRNHTERTRAQQMVHEAAATGRITTLDRDHRLAELKRAHGTDAIEAHVRDLRQVPEPAAHPHGSPGTPGSGDLASPRAVAPPPGSRRNGGRRPGVGCLVVVLMFGALTVLAPLLLTLGAFQVPDDEIVPTPEVSEEELLTPVGWEQMVLDLTDARGNADVTRVVVYDDHALLTVPAAGGALSYHYDAELEETSRDDTTEKAFDLGDVDIRVIDRMLDRVEDGLREVDNRHVSIRVRASDTRPTVWARAEGDGVEHWLEGDLDGEVITCECAT